MLALAAAILALLPAVQAPAPAPTDPLELVKQGRKLVTEGRIEDALALYAKALDIDPNLVDAHLAAGIALDLQLRCDEARTHLSRALELSTDENRGQALNALAISYAFEGKAREAATFYQRLLDGQTTAADYAGAAATSNALGRVYLETGVTDEAHRWYQSGYEYSRRQPESAGAELPLWDFRWIHAQGRIAARAGRTAEAAAKVREARALIDRTPALADQVPTWQYLAGYVALNAKDYAGAVTALLAADQKDPFVLALLAEAYQGQGDKQRARETWERVLASRAHSLQNAFARPKAMKALGR